MSEGTTRKEEVGHFQAKKGQLWARKEQCRAMKDNARVKDGQFKANDTCGAEKGQFRAKKNNLR